MEIMFLGTGSMVPTRERAQTSMYMSHVGERMLFDCGEGVQRQLRIAGISPAKLTRIFLTHWHGDHFFGLPGLLENLAKHKSEKVIELYGPRGTRLRVEKVMDACLLKGKVEVRAHDIMKDGVFLEGEQFVMRAAYVKHSVPCVAYAFEEREKRRVNMGYLKKLGVPEGPIVRELQEGRPIVFRGKKVSLSQATFVEKGKKLAFVLDTGVCAAAVNIAKGADVLVCESTFAEEHKEKAREFGHLTASQAAVIAKKAKVKRLVLTHFSQRYHDVGPLVAQARKVFKDAVGSHDFMRMIV